MQEINSQTKLVIIQAHAHVHVCAANLPVTAYCTIIHFYKYVVLLHDLTNKQTALKEKDVLTTLDFI